MKLSPIGKPQKKIPFAVVDIETMNWTKFIVLGFYDGTQYLEFRSLKKFFKFLEEEQRTETIFAHFGGKFDFLFLLKEILRNENYRVEALVPRGSSILYFNLECGRRKYTFRDSSALLPFALKSITENFGVATKKKDWDHSKTKGYSAELSDYLRADCVGLFESLEKFYSWPLIEKSGPAFTLASQAMRVLRTYLDEELWGLNEKATEFCRSAYLGGRTEIFRPLCEKGPLYEYDVNSLYPSVMRDNYFPVGNGFFTYNYERDALGIYQAVATAPTRLHIPCLGLVRDGKFIFPTGKFEGYWTSAEIDYAISQGYNIKIIKGYAFPEKRMLFKNFIDDLYSIRLTAAKNSVSDIIAKLLMNSSYGRFGMDAEKENIGFELKEGVEEYQILKIGGRNVQLYKEPITLRTFSHVGIAAFTTSYARIHMHKLFKDLGEELFYTDTDSIFTTRKLNSDKSLGGLKFENEFDSAVFLLPKTYYARGFAKTKIAMKGFDKKKIQDFTLEDFRNGLEGDLKRFKIENDPKFATLKTALAQKKIVAMTKKSEKQLKAVYSKRIIYKKDGEFFTKPIHLQELEKCKPKKQEKPRPQKRANSKKQTPKFLN